MQKLRDGLDRHGIQRPDERVLGRISLKFTSQLYAADTDEQYLNLYQHVKSLPSTKTRMQISEQCKLNLNEPA